MEEEKYTLGQQIPVIYIDERVQVKEGHEVEIRGEIYLPEKIYTRNKEQIEKLAQAGNEITVDVGTEEHKVRLRYKREPLEHIVCGVGVQDSDGYVGYKTIDVTSILFGYLSNRLSKTEAEHEDDMTELIILEYDLERMRGKYRCRKVTVTLEEDVEIQGIIFTKGTEIQGQLETPKSFCQCII